MVTWAPFDPLEFDTHHELENENIVKSIELFQRIPCFWIHCTGWETHIFSILHQGKGMRDDEIGLLFILKEYEDVIIFYHDHVLV